MILFLFPDMDETKYVMLSLKRGYPVVFVKVTENSIPVHLHNIKLLKLLGEKSGHFKNNLTREF